MANQKRTRSKQAETPDWQTLDKEGTEALARRAQQLYKDVAAVDSDNRRHELIGEFLSWASSELTDEYGASGVSDTVVREQLFQFVHDLVGGQEDTERLFMRHFLLPSNRREAAVLFVDKTEVDDEAAVDTWIDWYTDEILPALNIPEEQIDEAIEKEADRFRKLIQTHK